METLQMNRKFLSISVGVVALAGSIALAQQGGRDAHGAPTASQPEMQLPAGWSEADMQACIIAGTPGDMHAELAKGVGVWHGVGQMWMAPGMDPIPANCVNTVTTIMDGRFIQCDMKGEMPGMGPFTGHGVYGFDNAAGKFVGSWIDNMGTGIMGATGELSADKKVMTWTYKYTCPITKKLTTMREVETITGPNTRTFEMFGMDPKDGEEFLMIRYEFTKKS